MHVLCVHTHKYGSQTLLLLLFCSPCHSILLSLYFILSVFVRVCACLCVCVVLEGRACRYNRETGPARRSKDAIHTQTGSHRGTEIETCASACEYAVVCLCVCSMSVNFQRHFQRELE